MRYPSLVPDSLCHIPATVEIEQEGVDDTGEPLQSVTVTANCNYQEKTSKVFADNKVTTVLSATAVFNGDIAPGISAITGGYVTILGNKRIIQSGCKSYNPDGTVNFTSISLE